MAAVRLFQHHFQTALTGALFAMSVFEFSSDTRGDQPDQPFLGVSQDWRTWAKRGYIDMVNVSGYCYRQNDGDHYLRVLEDRLAKAAAINRDLGDRVDVTMCLGIVTSHGQIESADEISTYLAVAKRVGVQGAAIYTWSSFEPFFGKVDLRE